MAVAAMARSDKGTVMPFRRREHDNLPAFIQWADVISIVGMPFRSSAMKLSSAAFLAPCSNSAMMMPVVHIRFEWMIVATAAAFGAVSFKKSIRADVSTRTPSFVIFRLLFQFESV